MQMLTCIDKGVHCIIVTAYKGYIYIFMQYSGVEFGMAVGVLGGHQEKQLCNTCIYLI